MVNADELYTSIAWAGPPTLNGWRHKRRDDHTSLTPPRPTHRHSTTAERNVRTPPAWVWQTIMETGDLFHVREHVRHGWWLGGERGAQGRLALLMGSHVRPLRWACCHPTRTASRTRATAPASKGGKCGGGGRLSATPPAARRRRGDPLLDTPATDRAGWPGLPISLSGRPTHGRHQRGGGAAERRPRWRGGGAPSPPLAPPRRVEAVARALSTRTPRRRRRRRGWPADLAAAANTLT